MTQYQYKISTAIGDASPDLFSESSTQLFPLGTRYEYGENTYRYAKAGAAIKAGLVVQAAAITEGDIAVQSAVTAGDKTISVTTTQTTADNQYDEGYLFITQNDAQPARVGGTHRIKSHTSGSSGTLTFTLYEPIKIALNTSSKVTIVANSYNGVITAAATPTAELVGVTHPLQDVDATITSGYYFWLQTHGLAAVVATDVSDLTLIGQGVYYVSNGTAGNITSLLGEAAGGGTSITTTNQNLNVKIGTLVDAPGGTDADAAVIRLSGFN